MHALQIGSYPLIPTSWTDPHSLQLDQMAHYNNSCEGTLATVNGDYDTLPLTNFFLPADPGQRSLGRQDRFPEAQENHDHEDPSSRLAFEPQWQTPTQLEAMTNFHWGPDDLQHNASLLNNFPQDTDVDSVAHVTVSRQDQLPYPQDHGYTLQNPGTPLRAPHKRTAGPVSQKMEPSPKRQRAVNACDRCRRRRQKCSEQMPCNLCEKDGALCHYREMPQTRAELRLGDLKAKHNELMAQFRQLKDAHEELKKLSTSLPTTPDETAAVDSKNTRTPSISRAEGGHQDTLPAAYGRDGSQIPTGHDFSDCYLLRWPWVARLFADAGVSLEDYSLETTLTSDALQPCESSPSGSDGVATNKGPHVRQNETDRACARKPGLDASAPRRPVPGREIWSHDRDPLEDFVVDGCNPDGSLDLRSETIWDLCALYIRNAWAVHPILDVRWTKSQMEMFVDEHSPPAFHGSRQTRHPLEETTSGSRTERGNASMMVRQWKKSLGQLNAAASHANTYGRPQWQTPKKDPDRSLHNAIILLILALGKVFAQDNTSSSVGKRKVCDGQEGHSVRRAATSWSTAPSDSPQISKTVPGAGYVSRAVGILGNNLGGNSILHTQAFLLAGLYYGHICRPMDSWSWINRACTAAAVLRKKVWYREYLLGNSFGTRGSSDSDDPRCQLVTILCWSAMRLERELHDEFAYLPKSSLSTEPRSQFRVPDSLIGTDHLMTLHDGSKLNTGNVLTYYLCEIRLDLAFHSFTAMLDQEERHEFLGSWLGVSADHKSRLSSTTPRRRSADHDLRVEAMLQILQSANIHPVLDPVSGNYGDDFVTKSQERLQSRYHANMFNILRPYLHTALRWELDGELRMPPPLTRRPSWFEMLEMLETSHEIGLPGGQQNSSSVELTLPDSDLSYADFQSSPALAAQFLWCCKRAVCAGIQSLSPDSQILGPRDSFWRSANKHGTLLWHFEVALTLFSVSQSWLKSVISAEALEGLIKNAIHVHNIVGPADGLLRANQRVLEAAMAQIRVGAP